MFGGERESSGEFFELRGMVCAEVSTDTMLYLSKLAMGLADVEVWL